MNMHLATLDEALTQGQQRISAYKTCLRNFADSLTTRFHSGEAVETLVHARADIVDEVLRRIWTQYLPASVPASLIAVGGYGRGELHPASDVDVLILVKGDPAALEEELSSLVMFLWDIGLEVGHSVRSLEDCIFQADSDITIATNLMESRLISGDATLFTAMKTETAADEIWPSDRFFEAKCQEQRVRHHKYNDSAYNLEPNIKENPGGLRDIQIIGWVAKRHFNAHTMHDLVTHGFLTEAEYLALMAGQSLLWKIRFALHILTGRHDDRLLFEYQRTIAKDFGYVDDDNQSNLAVEGLMQEYYRVVMELNRLNEMLLQHYQEEILLKNSLSQPVKINSRFQSQNGYIEVTGQDVFSRNPFALLEVFLILQQQPDLLGVRASTIRLIRTHIHLIDNKFRDDIQCRSLFMEILKQPSGITHELRRMHHYGVLASYLPEFGKIVGLMQFDLFHIFTVDEHVLMVVRNLRRIAVPEFQEEFPLASHVFHALPKPELLYIAGLFHDIAKGRGGSHASLGAVDTRAFCKRHDLSDYDAELCAWLVENHLLMSHTAQRKDIDDPTVIQHYAETVGDQVKLDYLYLLTGADIRATNPHRWNSFKDSLLNKLYSATSQTLTRGLDNSPEQDTLIQQKQNEARRLLYAQGYSKQQVNDLWMTLNLEYFLQRTPTAMAWHTQNILDLDDASTLLIKIRTSKRRGYNEIFLFGPDQRGFFARITALLDKLHLNVLEARIHTTTTHRLMNSFMVLENNGSIIEGKQREQEIIDRLSTVMDDIDLSIDNQKTPRQMREFDANSDITFHQDDNSQQTILALGTLDCPGLLHRVSKVFVDQDINLHKAKIATLGARVEDRFWLSHDAGKPLTDLDQQQALKDRLLKELDR